MVEEITCEMARLHTSIRQRGLRPEHVHGVGTQVRVMLAHARAVDMDDRVRTGIGLAIDRRGRDALINMELDRPAIAAGLQAIGMDVTAHTPVRALSHDMRVKTLDQFLASGVTSPLGRLEQPLAETEIAADRNASDLLAAPHIARVGCSDGGTCWRRKWRARPCSAAGLRPSSRRGSGAAASGASSWKC